MIIIHFFPGKTSLEKIALPPANFGGGAAPHPALSTIYYHCCPKPEAPYKIFQRKGAKNAKIYLLSTELKVRCFGGLLFTGISKPGCPLREFYPGQITPGFSLRSLRLCVEKKSIGDKSDCITQF
jgi:hypothetical protein